jgi:hypothetical protein
MKKIKKKIFKIIAFFTVNSRFYSISREARLAIIEYKRQRLINSFKDIDTELKSKNK